MTTSKLKSDVAAIACNADGCMIQLEQSEDNCTTVEYGRGVSVYFKKSEGTLIIKHSMGLLARLLGGESRVKVRALNAVGAKTGDTVLVKAEKDNRLLASFIVYILPVLFAAAGAAVV